MKPRNPLKNLVNPANLVIILVMFFACSDPAPAHLGTIVFTASHDCDIRLFDCTGNQIAREQYEVGKSPAVVNMKSSGVFVVHAVFVGAGLAPARTTIKEPMAYHSGNLEYYIEF